MILKWTPKWLTAIAAATLALTLLPAQGRCEDQSLLQMLLDLATPRPVKPECCPACPACPEGVCRGAISMPCCPMSCPTREDTDRGSGNCCDCAPSCKSVTERAACPMAHGDTSCTHSPDDVLSFSIENLLGWKGQCPPPPVPQPGHMGAVSYPVPVPCNGTISLPLSQALSLQAMTPSQAPCYGTCCEGGASCSTSAERQTCPMPVYGNPCRVITAEDILNVWINSILGQNGQYPQIHASLPGNFLTSVGYPVPVRDGNVLLPLNHAMRVQGTTPRRAQEAVPTAHIAGHQLILQPDVHVIVTLMQPKPCCCEDSPCCPAAHCQVEEVRQCCCAQQQTIRELQAAVLELSKEIRALRQEMQMNRASQISPPVVGPNAQQIHFIYMKPDVTPNTILPGRRW